MAGILYIISAPSGSGKSTLVNELRTIVPNLEFSIPIPHAIPGAANKMAGNITLSLALSSNE
jgi:energy-coupling factor transporter ATP-binding protein EcfA2